MKKKLKDEVLHLSDQLSLPTAYATSRNMVLAQSGAGKSNAAAVLAEEMYRVGIPWVAIDPKGDWYGVRSNRSGKQRGLDVPVFGGEFGDMPLSPLAGARMAELVAAGKFAGVLDVSDFPKPQDASKFLTDFANTLLKKQRTPVHLFLEECADYLPQGGYRGQIDPFAAACVGAMKRLATKGRFRGIGYTLISQRAAEVNKTVLYQCETLIALRMVGDLDIEWIAKWVKRSSKRAPELLDTIHELRDGECWVWSPARLKIIERVQARRRTTFDSGATPEIGEARVVPKMAPVELDALRKELADLEEQAKADDPRMLRARIVELEKLAKANEREAKLSEELRTQVTPKRVEVQVVSDKMAARLEKALDSMKTNTESMLGLVDKLKEAIAPIRFQRAPAPSPITPREKKARDAAWAATKPPSTDTVVVFGKHISGPKPNGKSNGAIGGGLRRMMIALAQRPGLTNRQLGVRAGLSSRSGTFSTYLSRARSEGWIIDDGERRSLTPAGEAALGHWEPLPEGRALLDYWLNELGGGANRMLSVLAEAYPRALTNEELGTAAEISHRSGTFSTYLSRLRTLELVEGKGELKLSEELAS